MTTTATPLRPLLNTRRRLDVFDSMPTSATPANHRKCSPVCTDLSPHIEALLDADVLNFCREVTRQQSQLAGTPSAKVRDILALPSLDMRDSPLAKALNPKAAAWKPPPAASAPASPTGKRAGMMGGAGAAADKARLNVDAPEFCPSGWADDSGRAAAADAVTVAMAAQIEAMSHELELQCKKAVKAEAALALVQNSARAQQEDLEREVESAKGALASSRAAQQRQQMELSDLHQRMALLGDEVCELHGRNESLTARLQHEQAERQKAEAELASLKRGTSLQQVAAKAEQLQLAGSAATLQNLQNEVAALRVAVSTRDNHVGGSNTLVLPSSSSSSSTASLLQHQLPTPAAMQAASGSAALLPASLMPTSSSTLSSVVEQPPPLMRAASAPAASTLEMFEDEMGGAFCGEGGGAVRTHRSRRGGRGKGGKGKAAMEAAAAALAGSKENTAMNSRMMNNNNNLPQQVSSDA